MSSLLAEALPTFFSNRDVIAFILSSLSLVVSIISLIVLLADQHEKIARPPGIFILRIINFIYSKKVAERIFEPILADMQEEYFEALSNSLKLKAKWIHLRSIFSIFIAIASQLSISVVKLFITIWKIS